MNNKYKKIVFLYMDEDVESFLNSTDDEDDEAYTHTFLRSKIRIPRCTIINYEQVVDAYSEVEYIRHFRLGRRKANEIIKHFENSNTYKNLLKRSNSRANITPRKHIETFLWFAGHQTVSFHDVADRFNLSISSLHDVVTRVMEVISELAPEVIKHPTENRKQEISAYYNRKYLFPNILGSIDGSHIKIDKPLERSVDYFNRKDYYSVVLQGICDHELNFTDIFIGYPGSVHDARIFRNSDVFSQLDTLCKNGRYILGDSAYPLSEQLLTPYKDNGHLTKAEKYYNKKLSSCRVSIEHAFGVLKQRFRQLYHIKLKGHRRICHFIRACCVLHNIASKSDMSIFAEAGYNDDQPTPNDEQTSTRKGSDIRKRICQEMYQMSHVEM